jgi:hypothetical protein
MLLVTVAAGELESALAVGRDRTSGATAPLDRQPPAVPATRTSITTTLTSGNPRVPARAHAAMKEARRATDGEATETAEITVTIYLAAGAAPTTVVSRCQRAASARGSSPGLVAPRRLARMVVTNRPWDSTWTSMATGPTPRANVVRDSRLGSCRSVSTTTQPV